MSRRLDRRPAHPRCVEKKRHETVITVALQGGSGADQALFGTRRRALLTSERYRS